MANGHTADANKAAVREIWKITIYLSVLTIIELALGLSMIGMPLNTFHYFIKGVIIILMLWKGFYIIAYFMHLKHEIRSMILSIAIPMLLFIWFVLAFLGDGQAYNNLKNQYDPYYKEHTHTKMTPVEHEPQKTPEKNHNLQ